jgi:hypothetical protein
MINIVAYLLKVRIVDPEKQPLIGVFCAVRAKNI